MHLTPWSTVAATFWSQFTCSRQSNNNALCGFIGAVTPRRNPTRDELSNAWQWSGTVKTPSQSSAAEVYFASLHSDWHIAPVSSEAHPTQRTKTGRESNPRLSIPSLRWLAGIDLQYQHKRTPRDSFLVCRNAVTPDTRKICSQQLRRKDVKDEACGFVW